MFEFIVNFAWVALAVLMAGCSVAFICLIAIMVKMTIDYWRD